MTPKRITWGRFQLEFSDDRFRLQIAGSPLNDGLMFSLLGFGVWGIIAVPFLLMKYKVSPWLHVAFGGLVLFCFGLGWFIGRRAKGTGFVATRTPRGLSTMEGGQATLIPAEDIERFETREEQRTVAGRPVDTARLIAHTRRGEVVVIPAMMTNKTGCDVFGRLLSSLVLGHGSFEVAVRQALEIRRKDLRFAAVLVAVMIVIFIFCLIFFFRNI